MRAEPGVLMDSIFLCSNNACVDQAPDNMNIVAVIAVANPRKPLVRRLLGVHGAPDYIVSGTCEIT
jgi:hypothetical protein